METFQIPQELIAHVEAFDAVPVSLDDIEADVVPLFPKGSLEAKFLIDAIIYVASLDGLSDTERETTIAVAQRLGLRPELVRAYEARTQYDLCAAAAGNPELLAKSFAHTNAQWHLS